VRHDDMRAVATGDACAERARAQAQQLLTLLADRAFAASDPRIRHDLVADFDAGRVRPERDDLAGDLVPHRERQVHAARLERDLLTAAEIEMPVPDMHVAVADAGSLHPQQHLVAFRFRIGVVPRFQRLPPFDDLHRTHLSVLPFRGIRTALPKKNR
jgi:hypothetical protein